MNSKEVLKKFKAQIRSQQLARYKFNIRIAFLNKYYPKDQPMEIQSINNVVYQSMDNVVSKKRNQSMLNHNQNVDQIESRMKCNDQGNNESQQSCKWRAAFWKDTKFGRVSRAQKACYFGRVKQDVNIYQVIGLEELETIIQDFTSSSSITQCYKNTVFYFLSEMALPIIFFINQQSDCSTNKSRNIFQEVESIFSKVLSERQKKTTSRTTQDKMNLNRYIASKLDVIDRFSSEGEMQEGFGSVEDMLIEHLGYFRCIISEWEESDSMEMGEWFMSKKQELNNFVRYFSRLIQYDIEQFERSQFFLLEEISAYVHSCIDIFYRQVQIQSFQKHVFHSLLSTHQLAYLIDLIQITCYLLEFISIVNSADHRSTQMCRMDPIQKLKDFCKYLTSYMHFHCSVQTNMHFDCSVQTNHQNQKLFDRLNQSVVGLLHGFTPFASGFLFKETNTVEYLINQITSPCINQQSSPTKNSRSLKECIALLSLKEIKDHNEKYYQAFNTAMNPLKIHYQGLQGRCEGSQYFWQEIVKPIRMEENFEIDCKQF